jgi:peptidoglycan/xylan/chitin deacetylase (PgdA/CDA1 family)
LAQAADSHVELRGAGDGRRHRVSTRAFDTSAPDLRKLLLDRRSNRRRSSFALRTYYRMKPFVPRAVQLAARRRYARRIASALERGERFPRWPIEPILVDRNTDRLRALLSQAHGDHLTLVDIWPRGHRFAFILTHDVEGPDGVDNIARVRDVERRHGMVSSWNFVAEGYEVDASVFDQLRRSGCEVGLHGVSHDGRLFQDRRSFDEQLPRIRHYLREWGVEGFRSPATYRNADWMPELGCGYDSSFPDTDPFEPQPGGCCSILPFFLGDVVELPITLTQDHTVFEILRVDPMRLWAQKAAWIIREHGLVTVLVHPDYVLDDARLAVYDELLGWLAAQTGGWHALPREVAAWWRARDQVETAALGRDVTESELVQAGATLGRASVRNGELVFDTGLIP